MSANWHILRTKVPDVRAVFLLERDGVRIFRPLERRYYIDKRTMKEAFREASLFNGYILFRAGSALEYSRARNSDATSYVLGSYDGERFTPHVISAAWVDDLERAGPVIIGKKVAFRKGDKVKLLVGRISDLILEVESVDEGKIGLDKVSKVKLQMNMFGKPHVVVVPAERLELAEPPGFERGLLSGARHM